MELFTILKVGYTRSKIYGCTGEYFTCIYTNKEGLESFSFYGMYGVEARIRRQVENRGFKYQYLSHDFGQMTRKEILPIFKSEKEAEEIVKGL